MTRIHSPTTKGLHNNIPIALCTSSRLNGAPDTNGFPGSRAQHEATEGPEVTVSVKLSGFCSANNHQPPLLTAITYFLKSSRDTKYPKCPTQYSTPGKWMCRVSGNGVSGQCFWLHRLAVICASPLAFRRAEVTTGAAEETK